MIRIDFEYEEDFLKIKETLERIGIPSYKNDKKILYQSCHILHKRGKYYIVHFKELFSLDGKTTNITQEDLLRRDKIALLLEEWGLLTICKRDNISESAVDYKRIKIIPHNKKHEWNLVSKYNIGNR